MRGIQCGAGRAFEKAQPRPITRARARRRGGIPDRPGFLRSNARQSSRSPSMAQVSPGGRPGLRSSSGVVGGGPLGRTSRVFFVFFWKMLKKYAAARAPVRAIPHQNELRSLRLPNEKKTKQKQKQKPNKSKSDSSSKRMAFFFFCWGEGGFLPFPVPSFPSPERLLCPRRAPRAGRVRFDGAFLNPRARATRPSGACARGRRRARVGRRGVGWGGVGWEWEWVRHTPRAGRWAVGRRWRRAARTMRRKTLGEVTPSRANARASLGPSRVASKDGAASVRRERGAAPLDARPSFSSSTNPNSSATPARAARPSSAHEPASAARTRPGSALSRRSVDLQPRAGRAGGPTPDVGQGLHAARHPHAHRVPVIARL